MDRKKQNFIKALSDSRGIIKSACAKTGIARATYYIWRSADEEFAKSADAVIDEQGDAVESKLLELINDGDTAATIFYCKTKLKNRGYSEKVIPPPGLNKPKPTDKKSALKRIEAKKRYIIKLLKDNNKYTSDMSPMVMLAARLLVRVDDLTEAMSAPDYIPVVIEFSREGNERRTLDPRERLYNEICERAQRALRALGMNVDAKERANEADSLSEFLDQFKDDDE